MIEISTIRAELEHQIALAMGEIESVAEQALTEHLHAIMREVAGCQSLTEVRGLFREEARDIELLAEVRTLSLRDAIFFPGIYVTAMMRAVEIELARVVADAMRALSNRETRP